MNAPVIEFHNIGTREYNLRSSNAVIRVRVVRRSKRVEFDADFFNTHWELSTSTWRQISSAWSSECRTHPCKGTCGGGRTCFGLTVTSPREEYRGDDSLAICLRVARVG